MYILSGKSVHRQIDKERERERERGERERERCVFFLNFVIFFNSDELVYVFQSFVYIFAKNCDHRRDVLE